MNRSIKQLPKDPRQSGMSLASILAVSTVSSLWITAMMAIVLPTYQKTASMKTGTEVRAAAEAALDYTLNQMNNSISQGQISPFDADPLNPSASKLSTISPAALGLANQNVNIQVLVQNVALQGPQSGALTQPMIFDPQLAGLIASGKLQNPYRQMTASATIGSVTKVLRVMLVPQAVRPATAVNTSTQTPIMPFAIYGVNQTAFVGSVGLNSYVGKAVGNGTYVSPTSPRPSLYDPRVRADFGSGTTVNQVGYGSAMFSGQALGGSQMEFSNAIASGSQASSAVAQLYNAANAAQAPWLNIYDNVYSNYVNAGTTNSPIQGVVYPDQTTAGVPSSGYIPRGWDNTTGNSANQNAYNNVFGLSNVMGAYPFDHVGWSDTNYNSSNIYPAVADNNNMGGVLTSAQNYAKPQIPPVPSSPSNAVHLGSINLTGTAQIYITKFAPAPTTQIGAMSSGTLLLPPGDYSITGLNMAGVSKIIIDPSVNTPTNFYLEGNVSTMASNPAINIANTADVNMIGVLQTPGTSPNSIGSTGFNLSGSTGPNGHGSTMATKTAINTSSSINEFAGSAANLNIFYNGPGSGPSAGSPSTPPSTTFSIKGKARMTIFAPNANILIGSGTGYSRPTEFFGAVVGNWVTVTGPQVATNSNFTAFHYDIKLKPNGGAFTNPNQALSVWGNPTSDDWTIAGGYKAVTWQEAKSASTSPADWNSPNMWQ